jgi:hypothetical protein
MKTIFIHDPNHRFIADAIVDDEDYVFLHQFKWRLQNGEAIRYTYDTEIDSTDTIPMLEDVARQAGVNPKKIERFSKDLLDNRRENIWAAQSAVQGVVWSEPNKMWRVEVRADGRTNLLGFFLDWDEAVSNQRKLTPRPTPDPATAIARPLPPYWKGDLHQYVARIEVTGIPVIIGYFPHEVDAKAATNKYFPSN